MKRGISFELPNEYGTFLGDVLKPIDITAFSWKISDSEIIGVERLEEYLTEEVVLGNKLKSHLEDNRYYIIFADLKAYPKGKIAEISTYEEFMRSECELVLLVVDSCYATIYCKNRDKLELLYKNARDFGFENIKYITNENDTRTRLSVW